MEWKEVNQEEYKQAFEKIYQAVRDLAYMIEHDPNLNYEQGFERLKQQIIRDKIARPLTKIEAVLLGLIEQAENKNLGGDRCETNNSIGGA
ncbi:hypothetical protein KAW43_02935 [Candidatus Parcubacteria bacterium]|jgi:hypothetical protein|nr:hypothetical protein [Candidatus Parcubacteria bacterium]